MKFNAHASRWGGFTLIELLVVVAIVAVLASILSSAISGAKERARRTACQSNLKQLAIAMQQYVQDNSGVYPPSAALWANSVYSYTKNADIFCCPDHPTDKAIGFGITINPSVPNDGRVDYTYNQRRLQLLVPPLPTRNTLGVHETTLLTPSTIWLNVDAFWGDNDGSHYCRTIPMTYCGREFTGSTLHSGGGNYSYVDGHVKWLTPEEAGEVECLNGPLPAPFKN